MGESYLRQAEERLKHAKEALEGGNYAYVIRQSQEAVELGVERFNAYNTKENVALLDGDKDQNAAFREFVRENKPENAEVSDRVFEDYEGYVISIVDYMHPIQVEQRSFGIPAILSIDRKQDKMPENVKLIPLLRHLNMYRFMAGAGAVVTKDVEDNTVVGGVPARVIGS